MIAVVQRVTRASVTVAAPAYRASIGDGLCVLLGVADGDREPEANWMAGKLARLRVFRDDEGRLNRSIADVSGSILLVSQFTLLGDCRKGNRPSFARAAAPSEGEQLYGRVAEVLRSEHGIAVETGMFGEMMEVSLVNDGPVTLIISTDRS